MKNQMMWAYLIHLSMHMWADETSRNNLYMDNIWMMWGVILLCNILFKSHNTVNDKKND